MSTAYTLSVPPTVLNTLAAYGIYRLALSVLPVVPALYNRLLRPSNISKYLYGPAPYALVTGATGGIGKATAAELLKNGFNVIIHGRNEQKLRAVREELLAAAPGKDVRYIVIDADKPESWDFEKVKTELAGLSITVLVNNVGGAEVLPYPLRRALARGLAMVTVNRNALFPLALTHALIPAFRTEEGPVHVIFLGSAAADLFPPYLPAYAASKKFLETLAYNLNVDERFSHKRAGNSGAPALHFSYFMIAATSTDGNPKPTSFDTPSAARLAHDIVRAVGTPLERWTPYFAHALQISFMGLMGKSTRETLIGNITGKYFDAAAKKSKE